MIDLLVEEEDGAKGSHGTAGGLSTAYFEDLAQRADDELKR